MSRAKNWCFTLNNWTEDEAEHLRSVCAPLCSYLVFGREVGANGTRHLQGYVAFNAAVRHTTAKNRLGNRCHIEVTRGTPEQAATYCKKDGDYEEFGELPILRQGKRSDLDAFFDWAQQRQEETGQPITTPEACREHPSIICRYPHAPSIARLRFDPSPLVAGEPNEWQRELDGRLGGDADDRTILFYVDADGGKGKTWFVQWYMSNHFEDTQVLGVAKRDDLAHMIKINTRVFFFNVARGQMEYLQYSILEMLKDRMVVSPKYHSQTKILLQKPHVVVFSNEAPDETKLSRDRYEIIYLDDD